MKISEISDNTIKSKDFFSEIKDLICKVADKTLEELEKESVLIYPQLLKESDDLTNEQYILKSINNEYQSSNVMGFLGYKNQRLIINSRFSESQEKNRSDYFFQYLFQQVIEVPNLINLSTNVSNEKKIFEFLIFLFPLFLKKAARKGIFKEYILKKYNDSNIKGILDIPRHIAINTPFIGKVAYSRRELSYDNSLMELIRHTIEFIKTKTYGYRLLFNVKDYVKLVIEATPNFNSHNKQKIIDANKLKQVRHSFYREYSELQRLCIFILQYEKQQIGLGENQVYGVLFDGAWLWEEYVNILIEKDFYHPKNKQGEGKQFFFGYSNDSTRSIGLIYPDFIGKNAKVIADAKYKPFDNIHSRDYFQILSYMFRFDAICGYFIYPENDHNQQDNVLYLKQGNSYENNVSIRDDIMVKKIGLKIPNNAKNYEDFRKRITESEKNLLEALRLLL